MMGLVDLLDEVVEVPRGFLDGLGLVSTSFDGFDVRVGGDYVVVSEGVVLPFSGRCGYDRVLCVYDVKSCKVLYEDDR